MERSEGERSGVERSGVERSREEWSGGEWIGREWGGRSGGEREGERSGVERSGVEWSREEWSGGEWIGREWGGRSGGERSGVEGSGVERSEGERNGVEPSDVEEWCGVSRITAIRCARPQKTWSQMVCMGSLMMHKHTLHLIQLALERRWIAHGTRMSPPTPHPPTPSTPDSMGFCSQVEWAMELSKGGKMERRLPPRPVRRVPPGSLGEIRPSPDFSTPVAEAAHGSCCRGCSHWLACRGK